jgi:hypothetical protein
MEEFTNEDIKLSGNIMRYKDKIYKMFCERDTEWGARKVRDDLRNNGFDTVITEDKQRNKHIVWRSTIDR